MEKDNNNSNNSNNQTTPSLPLVYHDARFRAGRKLMKQGQVHLGAVKIFDVLLKRTDEEFGESSMESAAVHYEYGYAMFLEATREVIDSGGGDDVKRQCSSSQSNNVIIDNNDDDDGGSSGMSDEDSKVEIALEHMVIACELLYKCIHENENDVENAKPPSIQIHGETIQNQSYTSWAMEQLPRILIGIGYVTSYQGKHPDALNSYLNALPYRSKQLEQIKSSNNANEITLDQLIAHRLLVDVYVLIVEEILKCPANVDITVPESNEVMLKKEERIKIAKDHYDKAREELQEV